MDMPTELDYGQKRRRWLSNFGFTSDPFALYEAEAEQAHDLLPYFYVDREYFHTIVDDPLTPRPGFLFADRGAGKTAAMKMVARHCNPGEPGHRALPLPYDDFGALLAEASGDLSRITAKTHVRAIIRALTKVLPDFVPPTYWEAIAEADRSLLMGYIDSFGYPLTRGTLADLIASKPMAIDWDSLTAQETLAELARILVQLRPPRQPQIPEAAEERRFRSLYILVDRVDESPAGPEAAIPLLLPLVRDRLLLTTPNVAIKFFLPSAVGRALSQEIDLRLDRIPTCSISWDLDSLAKMVDRRLQYYSGNRITNLEQLCHSSAKPRSIARLLEAAEGSPRRLIRLLSEVIGQVVEHAGHIIMPEHVSAAIVIFQHRLEIEQAPGLLTAAGQATPAIASSEQPQTTAHPQAPPTGLYVDALGGQVYIDGSRITPPLTAQEFDLLRRLYLDAPQIVEHETLIRAVWPLDTDVAGDEQNLRKLISRLRERLREGTRDRQARFVRSARGRGYYLVLDPSALATEDVVTHAD